MPSARARVFVLNSLVGLVVFAGCGPKVDLAKGLQVLTVSTGWYDAGRVNGQNKLVPSISFTLRNASPQTLSSLQVNALFRLVNDPAEWGSGFLTAAGSRGLAAGATTPMLTIRSQQGYTSTDPRQDMLRNSHFVDAKVELSAKYGSGPWTRIGVYQIVRQVMVP
jgi:hypothetical protein